MDSQHVDLDPVRDLLEHLEARDEFSGVVVISQGGHELLASAHGYANRAWGAPVTRGTRFDTASITKLFTAMATLQLVEGGAFALDTSTIDYLGLAGTTISPAITPYHLLTHTSGIADDADEEEGERYEDLFVDRPNYAIRQTRDFLPQFAHKPPTFAPGQGCRYCNVGFVLLGLMIERATGTTYREYVTDQVFSRAGMARSGFFSMDVVEPDVAEGVEAIRDAAGVVTGWRRSVYSYPPIGSPDGGAHVTADDLIAFHRAIVDGRLLGSELTAELLSPKERHSAVADGEYLTGYGFEFITDGAGRVQRYWKEGVNVGTSAMLRHYPVVDMTLAVLAVGEESAMHAVGAVDRAVRGES